MDNSFGNTTPLSGSKQYATKITILISTKTESSDIFQSEFSVLLSFFLLISTKAYKTALKLGCCNNPHTSCATASSLLDSITFSAFFFKLSTAFPIALECGNFSNIEKSLFPSPNTNTSSCSCNQSSV